MSYTISFANSSSYCIEHNNRLPGFRDKDHIDPNGQYIILEQKSLKQAYEELFGESVREHNARQTDSRRTIENYLQKIKNEEQEAKATGKKASKHTAYEVVLQIGDKNNHPDVALCCAIMKEYLSQWKDRNPNFVIFNSVIHLDEATPHCHVTFIPKSTQNNRGLSVQNSMSGALKEMGFVKDGTLKNNPEKQWTDRERAFFEEICNSYGIDVHHPQAGHGVKHLETAAYKLTKDNEALTAEIAQNENRAEEARKKASAAQSVADRQHNRAESERLNADSETLRASKQKELREAAKSETEALEAKNRYIDSQIKEKVAKAKKALEAAAEKHKQIMAELQNYQKLYSELSRYYPDVSEMSQKMAVVSTFGTRSDQQKIEDFKQWLNEAENKHNNFGYTIYRDRNDIPFEFDPER